jgi:WD40 repeat protein
VPLGFEVPSSFVLSNTSRDGPTELEVRTALAGHERYELLDEIGSGGMGVVFRAKQKDMEGRIVALKALRRDLPGQESVVERFRREKRILGLLAHANIVAAYDAGAAGDIHFLVMEYVPGIDLARFVAQRGPLSPIDACRYARSAALGLQHYHARREGLVHRDIKPQNLMLTPDGDIKILDFGMARLAPGQYCPTVTQDGWLGTPDYVSPEQARDPRAVDIRSDIYSLGCALYFLLSGQPPFPGGTFVSKIISHIELQPQRISTVRADLPEGLQSVIETMMSKDPSKRYQTPADVARALEPFAAAAPEVTPLPPARAAALPESIQPAAAKAVTRPRWVLPAGLIALEPVAAEASSRAQKLRRSWLVASVAAAGLFIALLNVYVVHTDKGDLVIETIDASVKVEIQKGGNLVTIVDPKSQSRVELRTGSYQLKLSGTGAGDLQLSTDSFTLTRGGVKIVEVRKRASSEAAARADRRSAAPKIGELRRMLGHTGPVIAVAFSPDDKFIVSASGWPQGDRTVRLWTVSTGKELRRFEGHLDGVGCVAFSPDGRRLLSGSADRTLRLWSVQTGRELLRFDGHTDSVGSVAFTANGRHAVTASFDRTLRLVDLETGKELRRFEGHTDWIYGMALSPDGKRVVSAGKDWTLRVWDIESGQELRRLSAQGEVRCVAVAPEGRSAVVGEGNLIRLRDLESGGELRQFAGHTDAIVSVAFAPDGRRVLSGGLDGTLRLWDARSGEELHRFIGNLNYVQAVAISGDGRLGLSAGGARGTWPDVVAGIDFGIRLFRLPDPGEPAKTGPEATGSERP